MRRELVWVCLGNLLAFLGSVAGIKVLTFLLGPEEYGRLALGMSIVGFTSLVLYGPLSQALWRFLSVYRERRALGLYFFVFRRAFLAFGVLVLLVGFVAGRALGPWVGPNWSWLVILSFLFGMVSGSSSGLTSLLSAVRDRSVVALHQGADPWLRLVLVVAMLHWLGANGAIVLLGYAIGTAVVTVSQFTFLRKRDDVRAHWQAPGPTPAEFRDSVRELWNYASPFVLWSVVAAVGAYSDRWILQGLFGTRDVGIYFGLYQIANAPISLLGVVLGQLVVPIVFERAGSMTSRGQAEAASRLFRWSVFLTGLATVSLAGTMGLFSRFLVKTVTTDEFAHHHAALGILALGLAVFQIGQMLTMKGLYHNRPSIYIVPKLLHGLAALVFTYFMARAFGITGAAWGLCAASVVHLAAIVVVNRRLKTPQLDETPLSPQGSGL